MDSHYDSQRLQRSSARESFCCLHPSKRPNIGAEDGTRTRDLPLTSPSYAPDEVVRTAQNGLQRAYLQVDPSVSRVGLACLDTLGHGSTHR